MSPIKSEYMDQLFDNRSPGWFVCCRPSPRESWNYISPFLEPGKHLLWDRNGCRCSLKPVTKKGAQWESALFFFHVHASLNITAGFEVMYCGSLLRMVTTERRINQTLVGYAKCFGCTHTQFGKVPSLVRITGRYPETGAVKTYWNIQPKAKQYTCKFGQGLKCICGKRILHGGSLVLAAHLKNTPITHSIKWTLSKESIIVFFRSWILRAQITRCSSSDMKSMKHQPKQVLYAHGN